MLVVSGINSNDMLTKMKKDAQSRCADRIEDAKQHPDTTKKPKKEEHEFTSILKQKHGL